MRRIDLVLIGAQQKDVGPLVTADPWSAMSPVEARPAAVSAYVAEQSKKTTADAWLFWDARRPLPSFSVLDSLLERPIDLWHAGLKLGLQGLPQLLHFCRPSWMLNRDPECGIESSSWRLSLSACLVRGEILRQLGGPSAEFESLEAAGLEWGHRLLGAGVLMRHSPLLAGGETQKAAELPIEDEIRFLRHRFGPRWTLWALLRAASAAAIPARSVLQAWMRTRGTAPSTKRDFLVRTFRRATRRSDPKVAVIIPTLDRYRHLRTLLRQMAGQTMPPSEVIVVDQTPKERRQRVDGHEFPNLDVRVLPHSGGGQCSARNHAIENSGGDLILLLDDDVEVSSSLIERHSDNLRRFGADASCGVAGEPGADPKPAEPCLPRTSDVFPGGNTLVRRSLLEQLGGFDPVFDRGTLEDADLGMRAYLSGALVVLDPSIRVLHHRAPQGGLRVFGQRKITYAGGRTRLLSRRLPSVTEIYYTRRYFGQAQVREAIWLWWLGTLSAHGSDWLRWAKIALHLPLLPVTAWQIYARYRHAGVMLRSTQRTEAAVRATPAECA